MVQNRTPEVSHRRSKKYSKKGRERLEIEKCNLCHFHCQDPWEFMDGQKLWIHGNISCASLDQKVKSHTHFISYPVQSDACETLLFSVHEQIPLCESPLTWVVYIAAIYVFQSEPGGISNHQGHPQSPGTRGRCLNPVQLSLISLGAAGFGFLHQEAMSCWWQERQEEKYPCEIAFVWHFM